MTKTTDFFINNNLSSKNDFYRRCFHLYKLISLFYVKYYVVIIQAMKSFHYQMHPLIMMNSLTIPKGYTLVVKWVWFVKPMEMGLKFSKIKG